jgi:hypothetical protein
MHCSGKYYLMTSEAVAPMASREHDDQVAAVSARVSRQADDQDSIGARLMAHGGGSVAPVPAVQYIGGVGGVDAGLMPCIINWV